MRKRNNQILIFGISLVLFLAGCSNNEENPYDPDYIVSAPINFTVSSTHPDYIELTWEVPDGNDMYCNIYRLSGAAGSTEEKIGDTNAHIFRDNSVLLADVLYNYTVEPVSYSDVAGQKSAGAAGSVLVANHDATAGVSFNEKPAPPYYRYKWYRFTLSITMTSTISWQDNNVSNAPGDFEVTIYDNNLQHITGSATDSGSYPINNIASQYPYCYVKIFLKEAQIQTIDYNLGISI